MICVQTLWIALQHLSISFIRTYSTIKSFWFETKWKSISQCHPIHHESCGMRDRSVSSKSDIIGSMRNSCIAHVHKIMQWTTHHITTINYVSTFPIENIVQIHSLFKTSARRCYFNLEKKNSKNQNVCALVWELISIVFHLIRMVHVHRTTYTRWKNNDNWIRLLVVGHWRENACVARMMGTRHTHDLSKQQLQINGSRNDAVLYGGEL